MESFFMGMKNLVEKIKQTREPIQPNKPIWYKRWSDLDQLEDNQAVLNKLFFIHLEQICDQIDKNPQDRPIVYDESNPLIKLLADMADLETVVKEANMLKDASMSRFIPRASAADLVAERLVAFSAIQDGKVDATQTNVPPVTLGVFTTQT